MLIKPLAENSRSLRPPRRLKTPVSENSQICLSLQQLSMKPPAASKFLQRGGLGEAHLDNMIIPTGVPIEISMDPSLLSPKGGLTDLYQ